MADCATRWLINKRRIATTSDTGGPLRSSQRQPSIWRRLAPTSGFGTNGSKTNARKSIRLRFTRNLCRPSPRSLNRQSERQLKLSARGVTTPTETISVRIGVSCAFIKGTRPCQVHHLVPRWKGSITTSIKRLVPVSTAAVGSTSRATAHNHEDRSNRANRIRLGLIQQRGSRA